MDWRESKVVSQTCLFRAFSSRELVGVQVLLGVLGLPVHLMFMSVPGSFS